MEIKHPVQLNAEKLRNLDLHSVMNILNVIQAQLQFISLKFNAHSIFDPLVQETKELGDRIYSNPTQHFTPENLNTYRRSVWEQLENFCRYRANSKSLKEMESFKRTLTKIFDILETRTDEIRRRWNYPDSWVLFYIEDLKQDLYQFFEAVASNSGKRFGFVYDPARHIDNDRYLIDLQLTSQDQQTIYMPLLFKDVIRDLAANSRKYTEPGGTISLQLTQDSDALRFSIEDTGYGIPSNELDRIINYGYRATNVRYLKKTMGGGYGMTKTWYVTQHFKGRMWIDSEVNKGTRITIELPQSKWSRHETSEEQNSAVI